jgi:putative DNA primase/helicase
MTAAEIDFAGHIEAVARRLYGEPNYKLSTRAQLQFGNHGSLNVEITGPKAGTWFDFENEVGGGTLDLIKHRLGLATAASLDWLLDAIGAGAEPAAVASRPAQRVAGHIVETYDYTDEDGELLFQAVRFEPKRFLQRRPDGRGGWVWNIDDVRIVPYRLPTFVGATPTVICIAEGEKDVEALRSLDYIATCNPMGAGKWRDDFAEYFRGHSIVILPDNDTTGRKHAEHVARNLAPVAEVVRIVELPGLPHKGDVSDWLAAGGTPKDLCDLVATTEPFDPTLTANHANRQTGAAPKGGCAFR